MKVCELEGRNKNVLFKDDMIVYVENPKELTHTHTPWKQQGVEQIS